MNDSILTNEDFQVEPFIGPLPKIAFEVRPAPEDTTSAPTDSASVATPEPPIIEDAEKKITTGVDSVDCLCNFDGNFDDYGNYNGDIDDIYADYARKKFVHRKEKGPDRSLIKKIFEPEVKVAEKRVWWEDVDNMEI